MENLSFQKDCSNWDFDSKSCIAVDYFYKFHSWKENATEILFPTNTQKFWHIEKSWFVFQFRRPCAFLSIEDTTRSMRSTCCWPSSSLVRHAFRLETEKKALHNRAGHMYIRYTFLKKISTFLKDIVCPLLLGFRRFKSNSFYKKQLISKDLNPQKITA